MEIEEALRTYLLSNSSLTALIGDRIYDEKIEGALPAVVYFHPSIDELLHTLSGQESLVKTSIQYSAWALTRRTARTIKKLIESMLKDFRGTLSGITIQYIGVVMRSYGSGMTDGNEKALIEDLEFEIWYEE